ncbi:LysR family transcriptional regulator [Streptacidiphilus sp. P02-A3a]|uniref:LysR family transcriptional regulator n=1 Tax=Streptacidiphilus sp. P02-A3a TaxID=2704468 RepID=UPI0015FDF819|nr:LysR family transcriptional regulator [Streptacidiphilus sp. P02-A3a]QMU71198.1 LysR family transcriptional regulator [Streptacidiphilus sp. P02-A3a]
MPADIHPRLLRAFVAVAEELHFGRAAARIPLAQQAVSRDIQSLERQLGLNLFDRSTRRVELTSAGERLLPRAVRLLALHDEIARGDTAGPLLVDLSSPGLAGPDLTAHRILALARGNAPEAELLARFHGGLAAGAAEILARRLDVSFGRFSGLPARVREQLHHVPLRVEPMAVILAEDHPLAARRSVPLRELHGYRVDICAGNPATTEWSDLGSRLLAEHGLAAAPPYSPPVGVDEMAHYVGRHRDPVLTTTGGPDIPNTVTRPLIRPVPLSLVSLVHRPDLRHPGLAALCEAARALSAREGWLRRPAGSWLPAEDAALLTRP